MTYKNIVFLFLLLNVIEVSAQNSVLSLTPEELPKMLFGSWLNDRQEPVLIATSEYLIFNNKLWYYNNIYTFSNRIETANDVFQIECSNKGEQQSIRVYLVDDGSLYFEKDITNPSEYLIKNKENLDVLPKSIPIKWYDYKDVISITKEEILFNEKPFILDFFVATKITSLLVGYNNGSYSLFKIEEDLEGSFLYYSGRKFKKETFFQKYFVHIVVLVVILTLILVYLLFKWKITLSKKKEETKRKFTEIQLKSIRSQMNPHFLFNALSAIQHLINKGDNDKANYYLTEFSQLMRLTLDKSEKVLVPLSYEVESIKKYLELENLRFKFNYSIYVDFKIDVNQVEIPGMLVQPFVENAIIHGINEIEGYKDLSVEFKLKENHLLSVITDNGIGINANLKKRKTGGKRTSYGLKLAEDRIKLINESHNTKAKIKVLDRSEIGANLTGTVIEIYTPITY